MIIYMLFNEVTDMSYIGKTMHNLEERWRGHLQSVKKGSMTAVHSAIREHGPDVWIRVVLQHCETPEQLDQAEGDWIRYTSSSDPAVGYNRAYCPTSEDKLLAWYTGAKLRCSLEEALKIENEHSTPSQSHYMFQARRGEDKPSNWHSLTSSEKQKLYREWGKKGGQRSKELSDKREAPTYRRREDMTQEELEYYRQCGKMSSYKTRDQMTPEEIEKFREYGRKGAARSRELIKERLMKECPNLFEEIVDDPNE